MPSPKIPPIIKLFQVDIKPCSNGSWRILKNETKAEAIQYLLAVKWGLEKWMPLIPYTSLMHNDKIVMSDTPGEIADHLDFYKQANGHVLINGLGLGSVIKAISTKKKVKSICVIEKSKEVIEMVSPYYPDVEIIHADALQWTPARKHYDCVWHDIWNNIEKENIWQMAILHHKYEKICDWQDSWCRELCFMLQHNPQAQWRVMLWQEQLQKLAGFKL